MHRNSGRNAALGAAGLSAAVLLAAALVGSPSALSAQGGDGFLFKQPKVSIRFETGYGFQRAQSALFDWVVQEHTVQRSDFNSMYLGGEIGVRLQERWDLTVGIGYQSSRTLSEYYDYYEEVNGQDVPIEQVNELTLVPFTVGAKYYLRPRGRQVGRFAWIPERFVPYVGLGIGAMRFSFLQEGDFVAEPTLEIFADRLATERSAFLVRPSVGADLSLGGQFVLSGEARYNWARGTLDRDFQDFGKIDLDGLQVVGAVSVRF